MALSALLSNCVPETFSAPSVLGAEILSIGAKPVLNYTASIPVDFRFTLPAVEVKNLAFCNVTVTYAHPGTDDSITVEAWLPAESAWNERYFAAGGGGYAAGRFDLSYGNMVAATADGYATSTTDAGIGTDAMSGDSWALLSPGNLDLHKVRDFGTASLNDQAIITKHIIENFYEKQPVYSYWNGCSQGGRQGLALAQRFPTAYDGIAAGAPAIRLPDVVVSIFIAQQLMNVLGEYPYTCEFNSIREAAVELCDETDGVKDGIVQDVEGCLASFDPFELVGTTIDCEQAGGQIEISEAAAFVANGTFSNGLDLVGRRVWFGFSPSTDLIGDFVGLYGTAVTDCSGDDGCVGAPNPLGSGWVRLFMAKDAEFDVRNITMEDFYTLAHEASLETGGFFNTDDADLSAFRDAGGKMVTFHGLDDNLISYRNTRDYYDEVTSLLGNADDFYRYFEVPGLGHCSGGTGGQPTSLFDQLRAWVEEGVVPEDTPVQFEDAEGTEWSRILCPYPLESKYQSECGDATDASCWSCEG